MSNDINNFTHSSEALRSTKITTKASGSKYKLIVSMLSDIVWCYDADAKGDYLDSYISSNADRVLGLPAGTIGNSFEKYFSYVHPEDSQIAHWILSELLRTHDKEMSADYRLLKADGTILWVRFKGSSCIQADGQVTISGVISDITECHRSDEALRETKTLKSALMSSFPAGVIIVDPESRVIEEVNNATANLFGTSMENIIGQRCHKFLCPSSENSCPICDLGEKVDNAQRDMLCADGSKRSILKSVKRIQLGGKEKLLECFLEISEHKKAGEALKDSMEQYRSVVENAAEGIVVIQDGKLGYLNPRALKMIQASFEEVCDLPFTDFIHPDDRELVFERYKKRIGGEGVIQNYDFRLIGKGGLVTWGQASSILVTWDGRPATLYLFSDITERKMAEEALRSSEERYRAFFNTSRDCIFITSVDGSWIDFNDAAVHFFGYDSREDLKNSRITDLYANAEDRLLHSRFMEEKGYLEEYPVALQKKDGTIIDTLITSVTINDDSGTIIGYQGTIRNITERKKAMEALQESKEQLMLAVEGSGVVLWDWKIQTGEVMFSERWAQILGYTLEEMTPISITKWIKLIHPDDIPLMKDLLEMHFCKELPAFECELRMLHKDGHWVWILDRGRVVEWEWEGKPVRMAGTYLDITDRKRAEEELRASEDLYKTVISSASNGIIIYESSGKTRIWNKEVERVFGIVSEEIIGQTNTSYQWEAIREDGTVFTEDDYPATRTFASGEPCRNVVVGIRNANTDQLSWINLNTEPLFKAGEPKPYAVVISFSDITARKKFEDELENRVKERTRDLESKTAEMERFIYTVSHDLRSPLITVGGFVRFLEQDLKKGNLDRIQTDLRIIGESVRKMDRLLSDTLELSRIGRVANPPEDIPMGEIVQEALAQTAEKIRTRGVEVSVAPDLPMIHADRMRIVEVMVNILENSVKYMGDEPNPHIDIGYRIDESETVFFVRDNGIGIDPSQHNNVFELFYQIDPKSVGTGAGLAIVKRIIEVHGGQIWIESELGKGCTVCFTLAV